MLAEFSSAVSTYAANLRCSNRQEKLGCYACEKEKFALSSLRASSASLIIIIFCLDIILISDDFVCVKMTLFCLEKASARIFF